MKQKRPAKRRFYRQIRQVTLKDQYQFMGFCGDYGAAQLTFTKEQILELRKTWTFQNAWEEETGTVTLSDGLEVQLKLYWPSRYGFVLPGEGRVIFFLRPKGALGWERARANKTDSQRLMNLLWLESSPELKPGTLYLYNGNPLFFLGSEAGAVNRFLSEEMELTVPAYAQLEPLTASSFREPGEGGGTKPCLSQTNLL